MLQSGTISALLRRNLRLGRSLQRLCDLHPLRPADNAKLFRDLKHVGGRTVVSEQETSRIVKVRLHMSSAPI